MNEVNGKLPREILKPLTPNSNSGSDSLLIPPRAKHNPAPRTRSRWGHPRHPPRPAPQDAQAPSRSKGRSATDPPFALPAEARLADPAPVCGLRPLRGWPERTGSPVLPSFPPHPATAPIALLRLRRGGSTRSHGRRSPAEQLPALRPATAALRSSNSHRTRFLRRPAEPPTPAAGPQPAADSTHRTTA